MSNRYFRKTARVAGAVCVAAVAALVTAGAVHSSLAGKPPRKAREALAATRSAYTIVQAGQEIGSEDIVRTEYNDNTIGFEVHNRLSPAPNTLMEGRIELTVREESFYPLRCAMHRSIKQGDSTVEIGLDIEMFANVAVVISKTASVQDTSRAVLPVGCALIETGAIYPFHQLLFWYDRELGGRQDFDAVEATSRRSEKIVVNLVARDTLSVSGEDYDVDVYKVHREKFDATVYVDGDGRMVRVEQNFMTWDLTDWSHEAVKND